MVRGTGRWRKVSGEEAGGEDVEGGSGHHGFPMCVHFPGLFEAELEELIQSHSDSSR